MKKKDKYIRANPKNLTMEELRKAVETLAKRANQRLASLEKNTYAEHSSAYSYIERLAFDKGHIRKGDETKRAFITDIGGKPRFSRKTAKRKNETEKEQAKRLSHELQSLQKFLDAKTSTVGGTKEVLSKSYEAFTESQIFVDEKIYKGYWEDALIKHAMALFYSSINDLFTVATKKDLKASDMTQILEKIGITEDTTEEELYKEHITTEKLKEAMNAWSKNGISATDGQQIFIPEDI